jgi:hypothetical protein
VSRFTPPPTGPLVGDAGGIPPEAMEPLTIVDEGLKTGLKALLSWLELIWPFLLLPLPPLFRWVWVSIRVGLRSLRRPIDEPVFRPQPDGRGLRSLWDQVLENPRGALWPVPAALLPALIPFARDWDQMAPMGPKRFNVAGLLLAIAVIQIYGQLRTKRYKELADAEIGSISAGVERISAGVVEQGAEIRRISAGVNSLAAYLEEEEKIRPRPEITYGS